MGGAGERVGLRKRHREICSDTERCRLSQPLILVVSLGWQQTADETASLRASCVAILADDHPLPDHPPAASWKIPSSHTPVVGIEGNVDRPVCLD